MHRIFVQQDLWNWRNFCAESTLELKTFEFDLLRSIFLVHFLVLFIHRRFRFHISLLLRSLLCLLSILYTFKFENLCNVSRIQHFYFLRRWGYPPTFDNCVLSEFHEHFPMKYPLMQLSEKLCSIGHLLHQLLPQFWGGLHVVGLHLKIHLYQKCLPIFHLWTKSLGEEMNKIFRRISIVVHKFMKNQFIWHTPSTMCLSFSASVSQSLSVGVNEHVVFESI